MTPTSSRQLPEEDGGDCRSGTVATREPSRVSPSRPSGRVSTIAGAALARLVRAASRVAGAETDAPNYDAFSVELQEAVAPLEYLVTPPAVGTVVHYFNPSYAPSDNNHTGVGPYAAIVTRSWEYGDTLMCNLAVITPGKEETAHIHSVPERCGEMDDGKYPCWEAL